MLSARRSAVTSPRKPPPRIKMFAIVLVLTLDHVIFKTERGCLTFGVLNIESGGNVFAAYFGDRRNVLDRMSEVFEHDAYRLPPVFCIDIDTDERNSVFDPEIV